MSELNLKSKVSNWLNSQGYPLEMEFAKLVTENGFDIFQPYHFRDPESDTIRETDIVMKYSDDVGFVQLYFVVECKKSKSPWVIFSSKHNYFNRLHSFSYMTENARSAVIEELREMIKLPWFKKPERIGYGITQALSSGKDQSYTAMMSATKGAMSYFKEVSKDNKLIFQFVFPLVVLDGVLFESYLDDFGSEQLNQVKSSFVNFKVPIGEQFGTTVRVVTKEGLMDLMEEIKSMDAFLKEALAKQLKLTDEILYNAMISN